MAQPTLKGIDLGTVIKEDHNYNCQLEVMNMPMSPSSEAFLMDFEGVARKVSIEGVKVFDSQSDLKDWIDSITAILNGNQTDIAYISELVGTIRVMIQTFRWMYQPGETVSCKYNLALVEGTG